MGRELSADSALRAALSRYEDSGAPAALDAAFRAAGEAVAELRGTRAGDPADGTEARSLLARLPELERLADAAVAEAERAALAGASGVWTRLGLSAAPPGWTEDERSGARVLVVSACAPLASRGPRWLAERLLRLAATRWAAILAQELRSAPEEVWQRALGERYESVSRRYALRTRRSSGGLGSVLAIDERTFEAVRAGLARWLAAGPDPAVLTTELEAAFAGTRTPGRLA